MTQILDYSVLTTPSFLSHQSVTQTQCTLIVMRRQIWQIEIMSGQVINNILAETVTQTIDQLPFDV